MGRLGRSKASLEASGSVLEASGRPLGRAWAEKGGQHGSNLALKTELKSIKNGSQNDQFLSVSWNRFMEGFWWILDAKMELKLLPNGVKIRYGSSNTDFYELIVSLPDL